MIGFLRTGANALPPVRIEAERVYLRPPRTRDWRSWASLRDASRAFLTPWEPSWPSDALTRSTFVRRLRRQANDWRQDEGYAFFLMHKSDDTLLGGVSLSNIRRGVAQMASIGYWIGECHARQGYMTEGVCAGLAFAFRDLGLHRVEAVCLPHNEASRRLLETVGFCREGYARAYLRIDGDWQDHLTFAILREDFLAGNGPR